MASSEEEIEALLRMKIYPSREEVLIDAIRALLESKPNLKIEIAIDLYRRGKVSLWRASEIAGMSLEEFKEVLAGRGVRISVGGTVEESRRRISNVLRK
jgi:predicted HTH domain antitoxin